MVERKIESNSRRIKKTAFTTFEYQNLANYMRCIRIEMKYGRLKNGDNISVITTFYRLSNHVIFVYLIDSSISFCRNLLSSA